MPDTTDPTHDPTHDPARGRLKRLAWFFGLSAASSAVTVVVAYALRTLLRL